MDLSALIFVALAVAWAVYLIPRALRFHEQDSASRTVDSFSDTMRVLARREAVTAKSATLVVGDRPVSLAKPTDEVRLTVDEVTHTVDEVSQTVDEVGRMADEDGRTADEDGPAVEELAQRASRDHSVRRPSRAAARAAQRRRRVLGAIVLANVVVLALATAHVIAWAWMAAPVGLLVGWLVLCRIMARRERAARTAAARVRRRTLADEAIAEEETAAVEDETTDIPAVAEADDSSERESETDGPTDPEGPPSGGWDPVDVPLPTYVAKAPAGRTVRTIDLDSTGVWSSGRNAADSELARDAEASATPKKATSAEERRRASGA